MGHHDLNLQLRTEILEYSISLEDSLNKLLIHLLNIENLNLKLFGNKSSSLAFKQKVDLLNDIGIISKEEYDQFILFSEFRNQFIHNIQCSSFLQAIESLGNDRGKQLMKYCDVTFKADQEFLYQNAYNNLFFKSLMTINEKLDDKRKSIEIRIKYLKDLISYSEFIIDKDWDLFVQILDKCMKEITVGESKDLLNFKLELVSFINEEILKLSRSEEFLKLKGELNTSINKRIIKSFLK